MKKELIISAVAAIAASNPDGFTFNLSTMQPQTSGKAVARKETQNSFNEKGLLFAIDFAIANNVPCVGGWLDKESGLYYFDATEIFTTREEAEKSAKENEQIAFFDLDTFEEIRY